jgi:hypothetical protein
VLKVATRERGIRSQISTRATPTSLNSGSFAALQEPARDVASPSFSLAALVLQPKLTVGASDEPFEQEADLVAQRVVCMPEPVTAANSLQRKCSGCKEEEKLQRQVSDAAVVDDTAPDVVHEVLRLTGRPLDKSTRNFMESRFGHDFSDVRIHTEAMASRSAEAVTARAYTVGRDIAFRHGQYTPDTTEGRNLLAHELAHVVQQGHAGLLAPNEVLPNGKSTVGNRVQRDIASSAEQGSTPTVSRSAPSPEQSNVPTLSSAAPPSGRPVFLCAKSVAGVFSHAFFRVGGDGPGNATYELEHDEIGEHCPCGIVGLPQRDYGEDVAAPKNCVPLPGVTEECLEANYDSYPVGTYCARGPNSNSYARWLAEKCGAKGVTPPGGAPWGFNDAPPVAGTAGKYSAHASAFLPCTPIRCDDTSCRPSAAPATPAPEQPDSFGTTQSAQATVPPGMEGQ